MSHPTSDGATRGSTTPIGDGRLREVAVHADYAGAQRAVDYLSDRRFPVEHVRIVGSGVATIERVSGRRTNATAALYGAGAGAIVGLLLAIVLGLFVPGVLWLDVVLASVAFAALWGGLFGFLSHAVTRGERDFASSRFLAADRYSVLVDEGYAADAERLLDDAA